VARQPSGDRTADRGRLCGFDYPRRAAIALLSRGPLCGSRPASNLKRAARRRGRADHLCRKCAKREIRMILSSRGILCSFSVLRSTQGYSRRRPRRAGAVHPAAAAARHFSRRWCCIAGARHGDRSRRAGAWLLGCATDRLCGCSNPLAAHESRMFLRKVGHVEMELDHGQWKMRGRCSPDRTRQFIGPMTRPQCEASMTFVCADIRGREADGKPISTAGCRMACCSAKPGQLGVETRAPPQHDVRDSLWKFWDFRRRVGEALSVPPFADEEIASDTGGLRIWRSCQRSQGCAMRRHH